MDITSPRSWKTLTLAVLLLAFTAGAQAGDKARSKLPSISDIAEMTDGFGILYAALEATGFDDVLDGKRNYTVFAPSDEAFTDLLDVLGLTPEQLLSNTDLVKTVLKYHVTRGDRYSGSVLAAGALKMIDGNVTSITVSSEGAMIQDAVITAVDIRARNGVVHVIDKVLLPPGML